MDSSSSSSSVHASMPISSFSNLPPQDQLAVIERISPYDKPTLVSIASTNRQINVLATPLLVEAYIGHVENKIKTMKTSAERVAAILLVHRKLMENTSGLPVMGSEALWERLKVLILNEASCLASLDKLFDGIALVLRSSQSEETSVEHIIAFQRSRALLHEISQILTKGYNNLAAQIRDAARYF
ncbi:MAG TPA: hypothetical protein VK249_24615 [Anaerolineales bacterium]|nr:hypothetical protein [Anaerolineales bacterium]